MYQRGESLKDFFEHLNGCCYVIFLVVFLETFGVAIFQGAKAIASVQRSPRPPECPWCISGAGHPACVFGALPHSPLMCPWCTGADIIFTLAWCSTRIPWYALDAMCNVQCTMLSIPGRHAVVQHWHVTGMPPGCGGQPRACPSLQLAAARPRAAQEGGWMGTGRGKAGGRERGEKPTFPTCACPQRNPPPTWDSGPSPTDG